MISIWQWKSKRINHFCWCRYLLLLMYIHIKGGAHKGQFVYELNYNN